MRIIFATPLILLISLLSSPSWCELIPLDELILRDGLYYKKFTDIPFTGDGGDVFQNGQFKDGMKEGYWREYDHDGSLGKKEHFRKGELHGRSEYHYINGQKIIENYIDGKLNGRWEWYYANGKLEELRIFKDDRIISWDHYFENGQLSWRENYKDGKAQGLWEYFNEDGSLKETRTFKAGVLVK